MSYSSINHGKQGNFIEKKKIDYFKYTEKQFQLVKDIAGGDYDNICLYGGGRSGKTHIICWLILQRAWLYPESYHLIVRSTTISMKESVLGQTMIPLLRCHPFCSFPNSYRINAKDLTITLYNGSKIRMYGLSSPKSSENILGNEYNTIYYNECTNISTDVVFGENSVKSRMARKSFLDTRFCNLFPKSNVPHQLKGLVFYDFNPPSDTHWTYKYFIEKKHPITNHPHDEKMLIRHFTPMDNKNNIAESYFNLFKHDEELQKRFLLGEFQTSHQVMIRKEYFKYYTKEDLYKANITKIFMTTDYATTTNKRSDFTVLCIWAVVEDQEEQDDRFKNKLFLLDMYRDKTEETSLATIDFAKKWRDGIENHPSDRILNEICIEMITSSQGIISTLESSVGKSQDELFITNIIHKIKRERRSKYARAMSMLHFIKQGIINLPCPNTNQIEGIKDIYKDIIEPILIECQDFRENDKKNYKAKDDIVDNIIDAISRVCSTNVTFLETKIHSPAINY